MVLELQLLPGATAQPRFARFCPQPMDVEGSQLLKYKSHHLITLARSEQSPTKGCLIDLISSRGLPHIDAANLPQHFHHPHLNVTCCLG